jgi:hypothetical protein
MVLREREKNMRISRKLSKGNLKINNKRGKLTTIAAPSVQDWM